jgi:hypothetical protein
MILLFRAHIRWSLNVSYTSYIVLRLSNFPVATTDHKSIPTLSKFRLLKLSATGIADD